MKNKPNVYYNDKFTCDICGKRFDDVLEDRLDHYLIMNKVECKETFNLRPKKEKNIYIVCVGCAQGSFMDNLR